MGSHKITHKISCKEAQGFSTMTDGQSWERSKDLAPGGDPPIFCQASWDCRMIPRANKNWLPPVACLHHALVIISNYGTKAKWEQNTESAQWKSEFTTRHSEIPCGGRKVYFWKFCTSLEGHSSQDYFFINLLCIQLGPLNCHSILSSSTGKLPPVFLGSDQLFSQVLRIQQLFSWF